MTAALSFNLKCQNSCAVDVFCAKACEKNFCRCFSRTIFLASPTKRQQFIYLLLINQLLRQILYTIIITVETTNNLIYLLNLTTKLSHIELCKSFRMVALNLLCKYIKGKNFAC